jgi:hypothetical protein
MTRIHVAFVLLALTQSAPAARAEPDSAISLPWQLRPMSTDNLARMESAAAAFKDANGNLDLAVATTLSGRYQLANGWAPMVRLGLIGNNAPGAALDGSSFANPVLGATYGRRIDRYRLAFTGAATLPVGTGNARTAIAARTVRPADRVMYEVDSMAAIAGVDAAYVRGGFTAQAEATLMQLVRVRGGGGDRLRTRAAVAMHLGYAIGSHVAVGGDLHYQDTVTASIGFRLQFRVADRTWIRPGLSVLRGLDSRGLDAPLLTARTTAIQLDLPVTF